MSPGLLDIKIHIDRSLGVEISKSLPYGSTIAELKRQIAADDPTGQTRPEDFQLGTLGGGLVADGQLITEELGEVELRPADEAPEPSQAAEGPAFEETSEEGPPGTSAAAQGAVQEAAEAPASEQESRQESAGGAEPPEGEEESPEGRLFAMLDRGGRGVVSQRDVLIALRKHPPVRKLFGLDERGGAGLEARLVAIQDAFEAGSGLGEVAPVFDELRGAGAGQTFTRDQFLAKCQTGRMRSRVREAAASFHREHITTAAFVATDSWAEVPEGAACPGGLEYKMDMETGKTLARLSTSEKAVADAASGPPAAPAAPRMEDGGPLAYRSALPSFFMKRSEDPASGKITKVKIPPSVQVHSTGRVWIGPSGGRWAELDASKGADSGWVLIAGPGFGLKGPALVDAAAPHADEEHSEEDELPPGRDYDKDFLGVRRGRCKCGRCAYYRSPNVAVGG